jgi:hypothetical protein
MSMYASSTQQPDSHYCFTDRVKNKQIGEWASYPVACLVVGMFTMSTNVLGETLNI